MPKIAPVMTSIRTSATSDSTSVKPPSSRQLGAQGVDIGHASQFAFRVLTVEIRASFA